MTGAGIKKLARLALLTALMLVLGYVESLLPIAAGIPGVKIGLSNAVLLFALYLINEKSAALLMIMKVLLSGFLFAGLSAMLYALAGGAASLAVMIAIKRFIKDVSIIGVSVAGAVTHNIAQLAVAWAVLGQAAVLGYAPVLIACAVVAGVLTGFAAKGAETALRKSGALMK